MLKEIVNSIYSPELKPYPYASYFQHQAIVRQLVLLGHKNNFATRREYTVDGGRVDLVWFKGGKVYAGFEVDRTTPKTKSVKKLVHLDANLKIIFLRNNYGRKQEECQRAADKGIILVDLKNGSPSLLY